MSSQAPDTHPPASHASPLSRIARWLTGLLWFVLFSIGFFVLMVAASYWVVGQFIRGRQVQAPDVTGVTPQQALVLLNQRDLHLALDSREPNPEIPEGHIVSQYPPAGSLIKARTPVRVVLSTGSPLVSVPQLKGKTKIAAGMVLRNLGLEPGRVATAPFKQTDGGLVVATDPPAETGVPEGSKVDLLVSSGEPARQFLAMPDLLGRSLHEARAIIAEHGLILGEERKVPTPPLTSAGVQPNHIHGQYPPPGQRIERSSRVRVEYAPLAPEDRPSTQPIAPSLDPRILND